MIVWVEGQLATSGSTVWGCTSCMHGAWCPTPAAALAEALLHARAHGLRDVTSLEPRRHGPQPRHDARITALRAEGHSIRAIALAVGLSTAGVIKALRRTKEPA